MIYSGAVRAEAASSPPPPALLTKFEEGKHYQRLKQEIVNNPTVQELIRGSTGKIQIIEFFNYGCFGCSRLHPILEKWVKNNKPATAEFLRIPVVFHKGWEQLAKAFYVIKELKKLDTLDTDFFESIYEKHINLSDEVLLTKFFVEHGVPEKTFLDLYHSFLINNELVKGRDIATAYQIIESPTVVINGPSGNFLLSPAKVGSFENFIGLLNYIVSKEDKVLAGS